MAIKTEVIEAKTNSWGDDAPLEGELEPQQLQTIPTQSQAGGTDYGSMIQLAQSIQRNPAEMIRRAKQVGTLLAGDGFYSWKQGKGMVEGASIDLAEALAQQWGGIVYEVRIQKV